MYGELLYKNGTSRTWYGESFKMSGTLKANVQRITLRNMEHLKFTQNYLEMVEIVTSSTFIYYST